MGLLGNRLSNLRKKTKFRQEDIAKKLGLGRTTYAMYEQGKREPDLEILTKLADIFNVSLDYLLTGKDHMNENKKENLFFFDMEGLTDEEIEDIKRHIDYVKWKSKQERGKKGE